MRLAAIRPGDIVRAGGMTAVVIRKEPRRLLVRAICTGSDRRLRADEIEAHWRRARARTQAPA